MARITDTETKDCRCGKCPTYAKITEWSCGCVEVEIFNDRAPCHGCTDFSGMRRRCGQSGSRYGHKD